MRAQNVLFFIREMQSKYNNIKYSKSRRLLHIRLYLLADEGYLIYNW